MSHNKITINGRTPDATGAIPQALGDLSDVTLSSVGSGQTLVYDGAGWINAAPATTFGSVFAGEGAAQNYSGSSASSVGNGATVEFYANPPHNSLSATVTSASGWVSAVTVGVGTYRVSALVALTFSSAGSGEFRIHEAGTAVGSTGTFAQADEDCTSIATAIVTVASGTVSLDVRLTTAATNINTIANQGSRHAELGYLVVDRLA